MANGAVIITWGGSIPGREAKALEVFGKALAYFDELAKSGRVHGHKEYISLTGNVDDVAGTMVIDGALDELLKVQTEERTRVLLGEASTICKSFTVRLAVGGDEQSLTGEIGLYSKTLQGLGYL
jgi:hypothetical protein